MAVHCLRFSQSLPISLEHAWDFISSPYNLKIITPGEFGFEIISDINPGDKMHEGGIIVYRFRLLPFIRMKWESEISKVESQQYFIDEQRRGPFSYWRHRHSIKAIEGGVQMDDVVRYKVPFGFLGDMANQFFVQRKMESVFEYRRSVLEGIFGKM